MTLALCLILLRITSLTFGSYVRLGFMTKISAFHNSGRLEIIMPFFFAIILFFNAHSLLLLFLSYSAIIPKLCQK